MTASGQEFDPESVVGAYLFDEGKGDELEDLSGKGNNGNIVGNVDRVDGKFGDALDFSGGGTVTIPHSDTLSSPTFTLMAWINVDAHTGTIIKKDAWPDRNYLMMFYNGQLHCAFGSAANQDIGNFLSPTPVDDGEWHHLANTYDLESHKLYVDGILDFEKAVVVEPALNNSSVQFGNDFPGLMDEVLIANQALPEGAIKSAMEAGLEEFLTGGAAVSASGKLAATWGSIRSGTSD
jgi:hypothetical protein